MPLTQDGRDAIAGMISGNLTPLFDNANAHLGVGDGTTVFSTSQSDLQGTNKVRATMDSGYPDVNPDADGSTNKIRFKSTFDGTTGNFTWEEWGVFNALSGGIMLNRLVDAQGTKASGSTWVFEVDITVKIGS